MLKIKKEVINEFSRDVLTGLSADPKRLSSKYIYDVRGSKLFEEIMQLPEYYLTRCECEILREQKDAFLHAAGREPFNLVELGAGNGEKTILLLEHFLDRNMNFEYIPLDISKSAVDGIKLFLSEKLPLFKINGLVMDYFQGLEWLHKNSNKRNFIFFLGSNIGNMPQSEANRFLQNLWLSLKNDDLVAIGFDLKKDFSLIRKAYNDSHGVTAKFNLNLLLRMNRELGADFNLDKFFYYPVYNPVIGAHEAYIVSEIEQQVHIPAISKTFTFQEFEPIHTEYSLKYNIGQVEALAHDNGFVVLQHLFDSKMYFVDSIWKVQK